MTTTQKCNGWTNHDTWEAFNWIDSIERTQRESEYLARKYGEPSSIKALFIVNFGSRTTGVDLKAVNWQEVMEAFI